MSSPRNPRENTRGRPFGPGNPGKPKGARSRATMAAEALLDGEAEGLTRKAVELALAGDTVALRLCLERLVPPRKDRPIVFDLPVIGSAADHPTALAAVLAAVAAGELTPAEAEAFAGIMDHHRRAIETGELADRLAALEERMTK